MKFILPPNKFTYSNKDSNFLESGLYHHPFWGYFFRKRIEQSISLLHPPYKRILEIGYGSGILLPTLKQMGEVWGIDILSEPQAVLQDIGIEAILEKKDIFDYEPSVKFDLIAAISVFEHIANVPRLMNKLYFLLEPKGYLLIGMPQINKMMAALFLFTRKADMRGVHITNYQDILRNAQGFELISKTHFCGLYFSMLLRKNE